MVELTAAYATAVVMLAVGVLTLVLIPDTVCIPVETSTVDGATTATRCLTRHEGMIGVALVAAIGATASAAFLLHLHRLHFALEAGDLVTAPARSGARTPSDDTGDKGAALMRPSIQPASPASAMGTVDGDRDDSAFPAGDGGGAATDNRSDAAHTPTSGDDSDGRSFEDALASPGPPLEKPPLPPSLAALRAWERTYFCRLIALVPLYATATAVELIWPAFEVGAIAEQLKNCFEGFITHSYFALLVHYAGGYRQLRYDWSHYILAPLAPNPDGSPRKRLLPRPKRTKLSRLNGLCVLTRYYCLFYVIVNPILLAITALFVLIPVRPALLLVGDTRFVNEYFYVFSSRGVSLLPALLLIVLHIMVLNRSGKHGDKGFPRKFLTVKAIVFLAFWQHVVLSFTHRAHKLSGLEIGAEPRPLRHILMITDPPSLAEFPGLPVLVIDAFMMSIELVVIAVASWAVFAPERLFFGRLPTAVGGVNGDAPSSNAGSKGRVGPLADGAPRGWLWDVRRDLRGGFSYLYEQAVFDDDLAGCRP